MVRLSALIITLLLAAPSLPLAWGGNAGAGAVHIEAIFDFPYIVVMEHVWPPEAVARIDLNLSHYSEYLVYCAAASSNELGTCSLDEGTLSISFNRPVDSVDIVLVFNSTSNVGRSISVQLPLALAPADFPAAYTVNVTRLPSDPHISYPLLNFSRGYISDHGYYVSFNGDASPAEILTMNFTAYMTSPQAAIVGLERVIQVDEGGISLIDNYTLTSVIGEPATDLALTYPGTCRVTGVRGLLGPYPQANYKVSTGNSTLLSVKLIAPPSGRGDKAVVTVTLECAGGTADGRLVLPAYTGVGHYIHYSKIRVKVWGEARIYGAGTTGAAAADGYTVYDLGEARFWDSSFAPPVTADVQLRSKPIPLYLPLLIGLIAVAATLFAWRSRASPPVRAKAEVVEALKPYEGIIKILEDRMRLAEELFENFEKLERQAVSSKVFRQMMTTALRREQHLKSALQRESGGMPGELLGLVQRFDARISEIVSEINRLYDMQRRLGRGLIEKRTYRKETEAMKERVRKHLSELEAIVDEIKSK